MNEVLQVTLFTASAGFLFVLFTAQDTPLAIRICLYAMMFSCAAGFLGVTYMEKYTLGFVAEIFFVLTVKEVVVTSVQYEQVTDPTRKRIVNRRLIYALTIVLALGCLFWALDKVNMIRYKERNRRFEEKIDSNSVNIDSLKKNLKGVIQSNDRDSVESKRYRDSLLNQQSEILDRQDFTNNISTDNNLLLQRVLLQEQKKSSKKKN